MNTRILVSGAVTTALLACGLSSQETKPDHDHQNPGAQGRAQPAVPNPAIRQLVTGAPNGWFDRTRLFMGEFLNKEVVTGKFPFKNPTKGKQEMKNLVGSCQCVRAVIKVGPRKYELTKKPVANSLFRLEVENGKEIRTRVQKIDVNPGEKGEFEVHMEMGGLQGYKDATLSMTTSDPQLKHNTLTWQAKGVKLFNITPKDVFLNNMTWADQRKFSFIVESAINPKFKLLDHDALPEYVKLKKSIIQRPNGKSAWRIDGTFGPNADPKAGGVAIRYKTDWEEKEINLTVIATVTGPVSIEPGTFISFGRIKKGEGAERKITFVPNDDHDLQLTEVTFPKLTFDKKYISTKAVKDGKNLVVTVSIAPGVQGSILVRGSVQMKLSHPAMQAKTFNFNGILR